MKNKLKLFFQFFIVTSVMIAAFLIIVIYLPDIVPGHLNTERKEIIN